MEKTYTLQLANRVAQELRLRGAHVIMTRDSDRYVGLKPRPALAESMHADAFISFHFRFFAGTQRGLGIYDLLLSHKEPPKSWPRH
jgi:N-acetylmuramoyl-L-alanine amidase